MSPAEWLSGFNTLDYTRPAGPLTADAAADIDATLRLLGFGALDYAGPDGRPCVDCGRTVRHTPLGVTVGHRTPYGAPCVAGAIRASEVRRQQR
jgi:hypothetical protein